MIYVIGLLYVLGALSHWLALGHCETVVSLAEGKPSRIEPLEKTLAAAFWPVSVILSLIAGAR